MMELPGYDNWLSHNPNDDQLIKEEKVELECDTDLAGGDYCDYIGKQEVEVVIDGSVAYINWTCPLCGTTHDTERDADKFIPEEDLPDGA